MLTRVFWRLALAAAWLLALAPSDSVAELPPSSEKVYREQVRPFLAKHCFECHGQVDGKTDGKAGLTLDDLGTDMAAGRNADIWKEVIDRINLGEMPPKKKPRPDSNDAFTVVQWVGRELTRAERESRMSGGRITLRRMNRREYVNTVRDLLKLDANFARTLSERLPADGKAEGFDRLSAALFIDATQMDAYLESGRLIANEAIVSGPEPRGAVVRSEAETATRRLREETRENIFGTDIAIPIGVQFYKFKTDGVLHIQSKHVPSRNGAGWGRLFHTVDLDNLVTEDGYYRIRVKAGAFPGSRGEPIRLKLRYGGATPVGQDIILPVDNPLDEPGTISKVVYLRSGEKGQKRSLTPYWNGLERVISGNDRWYREIRSPSRALIKEIAQAKQAGDPVRLAELDKQRKELIQKARAFDEPFQSYVGDYANRPQDIPKLFLDFIEVEGPVHSTWPPPSHQLLFGISADEREQDLELSREVIERLLPRAYRRPVQPEEVEQIVAVIQDGLDRHGMNYTEAMRFGLQAVLCTSKFLYIAEPGLAGERPRPLNDFELASRLSYYLWSTMPDEELFALAEQGKLSEPDVLRAQVTRMLDDPRSRQFVESFGGQWLNVELYGSVEPANQYRDYDKELEESSKEEALGFFAEILGSDLPITNFLDSDFVMINERLARHYGIRGVEGDEIRKVPITRQNHRGGIFGMAGLMTLLADGTRTLPVRRAAWIMENVFNDPPPPPPPNAGEVQPNTSGANLTVRQRLDLHRNEPTCASCHTQLDPYGLALENYDAIGAWRVKANGEGFREASAPDLVVSGTLPSGARFHDLAGFKQALLEEKTSFARAFSEKMLTYALARPVGYVDRKTVDELVVALEQNDYRMRSLVQAIVATEAFRTK